MNFTSANAVVENAVPSRKTKVHHRITKLESVKKKFADTQWKAKHSMVAKRTNKVENICSCRRFREFLSMSRSFLIKNYTRLHCSTTLEQTEIFQAPSMIRVLYMADIAASDQSEENDDSILQSCQR